METVMRRPVKYCRGTVPKFRLLGLTEIEGGGVGVPVPVMGIVTVGWLGSSELTVRLPLCAPVPVGVKVTVNDLVVIPATVPLDGLTAN